ncbi:MAG: hypothetical protein IJ763_04025 [Lachnospiraceae bacterium]|nr:hypothetical protein [Lachnospiraceae bacterium]
MGLFDILFDKTEPVYEKKETFKVVGIDHYTQDIERLKRINPLYRCEPSLIQKTTYVNTKIFKYYFTNFPVKLVEEPKNEHDKNAIKVLISGRHVGYIAREDCLHIKKIMAEYPKYFVDSFIGGGDYKIIESNGSVFDNDYKISINITIYY